MMLSGAERQARYRQRHLERVREGGNRWQKKFRAENPVQAREKDQISREAQKARGYKQPKPAPRPKTIKEEARTKLNNAVRLGKVVRPDSCSSCDKQGKPQGHHPDYTKPLEVIWVCTKCHALIHHPLPEAIDDVLAILKADK